ncbi:MAG: hypothetical protein E6559_20280 [Pantoea sp.]|uniref:hypothetical protein n=1 Tax=Pantoea septica TaxID=472695 RepID=UPI001C0F6F8B|nr:hypothetical protein [Pantoea septica]MBU5378125.1 hypothetical protein [Pantoea septica]MDU6442194.1 hypothetical protein [Pantoea sp.]
MINIDSLDAFSHEFLAALEEVADGELQNEDVYLSRDYSLADCVQRDMKNINSAIELFIKARNSNDDLAMRAALLHIRSFMMGVSGVFYQTAEDIERFFKFSGDSTFPEDYKIPEHYKYPIK